MKWFLIVFCVAGIVQSSPIVSQNRSILLSVDPTQPSGELGYYHEGDMMLTYSQQIEFKNINKNWTGTLESKYQWPNKTIAFDFEGTWYTEETQRFYYAIMDIAAKTCIKFVRRTNQTNYIMVTTAESNCFSDFGFVPGIRIINLGHECFNSIGTIQHQILHSLGLFHTHTAYNRDEYITIKNIDDYYYKSYLEINYENSRFGLPYDYNSVMHFKETAFAYYGSPSIEPKEKGVKIGQRKLLSDIDSQLINRMYSCPYGQ
ncbi:hypothetical protein DMENIID0001_148910 [Sergentomyia squamirostris]